MSRVDEPMKHHRHHESFGHKKAGARKRRSRDAARQAGAKRPYKPADRGR